MNRECLREEYCQLMSDMLSLQYRAEVFRRRMQVECSRDDKFGRRMILSLEDSINDMVLMSGIEELTPQVKQKPWWSKWV